MTATKPLSGSSSTPKSVSKDEADLVRVEEAFPDIVPKTQFQVVNKLLRSRASKASHPRRIASSYLLSGLVKCHRCKTAFTGHGAKSGRFHYYVCQSLIKRGSGSCGSPRLNARRFEQVIVGRIRSSILAKDSNGDMTTVAVKELDRCPRPDLSATRSPAPVME